MPAPQPQNAVERLYEHRESPRWKVRLRRFLDPPLPLVPNPNEPWDYPLGKWNLYIGGAGSHVEGYVNIDIFGLPGVDVVADAQRLPFRSGVFQRVECDAVLEHVPEPREVVREIERVVAPGGYAHLVAPFCHPFHEYPKDYRRFTLDGLKQMSQGFDVVAEGWRAGPTATLLTFTLEYFKLWFPWRVWRIAVHGVLGWLLFPLRYLDLLLLRSRRAGTIGNHAYLWLRKPADAGGLLRPQGR